MAKRAEHRESWVAQFKSKAGYAAVGNKENENISTRMKNYYENSDRPKILFSWKL